MSTIPSTGLLALFVFVGAAMTFNFLYAFVLPLPFRFNPLFFITSDHAFVRTLSKWAWWGLLLPAHAVEALYCVMLVRRSTSKAVQGSSWLLPLLTFAFGAPGLKLLGEMEAQERRRKK